MPDYIYGSGVTNIARIYPFEIGNTYSKYDIAFFSGYTDGSPGTPSTANELSTATGHYYYSGESPAVATAANSPAGGTTEWTQKLFMEPSYGSSVSYQNHSYDVAFGDGYYNVLNKSENSLRATFAFNFNKRGDKEAKALVHLFEDAFNKGQKPSGGYTGVYCTPFAPYNNEHEFYIDNFDRTFESPDVNAISAELNREDQSTLNWQEFYIPFAQTRGFFETGVSYSEHDITYLSGTVNVSNDKYKAFQSGWYYYTGNAVTSSTHANGPVGATSLWTKNKFYFSLNQGVQINEAPRYLQHSVQNSYYIRTEDGINNDLLNLDFMLDGRTDKEAKAIVHFMEHHQGKNQFEFTPPAPYDITGKVFMCPSWDHTLNFKDNNSVNVNFIEFPINLLSQQLTFKTLITCDPYFDPPAGGAQGP
jgi:phage-related protein